MVWCVGLGTVSSLAFPPAYAFPLLWLTIPLLIWTLDGASGWRRAAFLGWAFGFGLYAASLYWVGNALLVASDSLWWLAPIAALALPAGLALFTALAAATTRLTPPGAARVLGFAAAWAIAEWLRGFIFTGFPWNLMGHSWAGVAALVQGASVVGLYGLTALAILSAVLPALAAARPKANADDQADAPKGPSHRQRGLCLLVAVSLPLAVAAAGAARLAQAPPLGVADHPNIGIRMVQANIPQREKWDRAKRGENFQKHLRLSAQDRPDWISHIVWPETAAAFPLHDALPARQAIASILPPDGALLTGTLRYEADTGRAFNSMGVVDRSGAVIETYDKAHLVPFGEYNPLADIVSMGTVTGGGFTPGPGPRAVAIPGLPPVSPLICYEAIFPGAVTPEGAAADDPQARAHWLLNLTNDAWYGETAGPHQHAVMAQLRSIEEGLPLFRATNTGITIAYDAYGRELGRIPLNVEGVLDLRLPRPAPRTLFSDYGALGFWLIVAGVAGCAGFLGRRRR
ncbi:MAG: apolipoprotein N-acyltransferase [Alphaproteobacteria bacterium]|nr:apolipoprotein N-acyltransferase [Alphaproteobacteria bacterium]